MQEPDNTDAPCVIVTVASVRGSVPGELGAKAVVTAGDGLGAGTLGGGKVEARAIAHARAMLSDDEEDPAVQLVTWNLQKDIGMTCGGEMTFLFERVGTAPGWHIVVFGAGHVAAALLPVLATLSCRIDVVDPRAEWLEKLPDFPNLTKHQPERYEDGVGIVNAHSFVLSITQGHTTDRPVLRDVLRAFPDIPFLGAIGSAAKRAVLMRELGEDGIADELRERVSCPLGLPVGGNAPAEIAISMAAQLLGARDKQ